MNNTILRFSAGRDSYEIDSNARRIRRLHAEDLESDVGRFPSFGYEEYARLKVVTHGGDGYALVVFWDDVPDGALCILAPLRGEAPHYLNQLVQP